eukprot:6214109-Pleurochrysis_carterae.AAC.1
MDEVVDIRHETRICKRAENDSYEYRVSTYEEIIPSDAQTETILDTSAYREFTVLRLLMADGNRATEHIVDFVERPYQFRTLFAQEAAMCSLAQCLEFFKETEIRRCAVVVHILSAILHLQTCAADYTVAHGDIKPDNIGVFVEKDMHIRLKLIDFGDAETRKITAPLKSPDYWGTPMYMNRTLFERILISRCGKIGLSDDDVVRWNHRDYFAFVVMFMLHFTPIRVDEFKSCNGEHKDEHDTELAEKVKALQDHPIVAETKHIRSSMVYESQLSHCVLGAEADDELLELLGTLIDNPWYKPKHVNEAFTHGRSIARAIITDIERNMRLKEVREARSDLRGKDTVASLRKQVVFNKADRLSAGCPEWLPTYMSGGVRGNVCKTNDAHPVAYKVTHREEDAVHAYAEYLLLSTLSHKNIVSLVAPQEFLMFYTTEAPICSLANLEQDLFQGKNGREFLHVLWWDMLRAVLFLQTWDRDRPSSSSSHGDSVKIVILRNITPRVIGLYGQANDGRGVRFKLNDFRYALMTHVKTHDMNDHMKKNIRERNTGVPASDGFQNAVDWFAIEKICMKLGLGQ